MSKTQRKEKKRIRSGRERESKCMPFRAIAELLSAVSPPLSQRRLGGSAALFNLAMDECPLSLPGNSPSMPNVQAPQSQYDSIEANGQSEIVNVPINVEDDEDYNLSDFSEYDDDIIEDFGMEGDGINRAIGGKQLEGVWNGEGDLDHEDSDELRSAEGSSDNERNSRPRFLEFN
ncbi:hypothetical protein ACJW30_01G155700 [Castanea mollissima]